MDHPSEETLKRFASCTASREEARTVVVHLLKGCAACSRKLKFLIEPEPVGGPSHDEALARFDRGLLEAMETSIKPTEILRNLLRNDPWPRHGEKERDGD